MKETIKSLSNPKIKRLVLLRNKAKLRLEENVFLAEGHRLFTDIPQNMIKEVYVTERYLQKYPEAELKGLDFCVLGEEAFAKVSDTGTPQGILAVVERPAWKPEHVFQGKTGSAVPLVMVLDGLQDPGNIGTIFRSSEGAGVTGILLLPGCADPLSPKTVRSTMGAIFRLPFLELGSIGEMGELLERFGITCLGADMDRDSILYTDGHYKEATAFMVGNEANGISEGARKLCGNMVHIPMGGELESLNAAVSASLLAYEAFRQRGFEK